eukprot:CAMPEP_0176345942 /NCGR_PEP_ID=MMETSP0126-20121128/5854_1 /TAXON_ID=141414 ORGANISM="Strombidinopsis acuminatum, Strain SPMC142" /NCGR_SAMPLE_ID=MMETSP0126 /ASSEMBLY_ACC=CAM_ASM_000229 /LENGTH=47 /DNA_ID= /DNA_START= /DNA_END= /DNA_ORIENTATION=
MKIEFDPINEIQNQNGWIDKQKDPDVSMSRIFNSEGSINQGKENKDV